MRFNLKQLFVTTLLVGTLSFIFRVPVVGFIENFESGHLKFFYQWFYWIPKIFGYEINHPMYIASSNIEHCLSFAGLCSVVAFAGLATAYFIMFFQMLYRWAK